MAYQALTRVEGIRGYFKGIYPNTLEGRGYLSLSRYPHTLICFRYFYAYFGKDKGIDQKYPNNALMRVFKSTPSPCNFGLSILLKRLPEALELINFGGLNA